MIPDLTVVIAIDRATIQQLLVSWPTWRKNRPQMWRMPWLILYDQTTITEQTACDLVGLLGLGWSNVQVVAWPDYALNCGDYETQRERMLSSFVFAPHRYVLTPWFMKIDADTLALEPKQWLLPEWFEPHEDGREPVLIASSWGYSKPKGGGGNVQQWAAKLGRFGRLGWGTERATLLCSEISGDKIKHRQPRRIASWLSYYRTSWTAEVAEVCRQVCGPCKLPVPSQDTTHFIAAECMGAYYVTYKQKRLGWTNCSRLQKLQNRAAEVMAQ